MRVFAIVWFLLLGCTQPASKVIFAEVLSHSNGLIVERPEAYGATRLANGFLLKESRDIRSPHQVSVEVVAVKPHALRAAQSRTLKSGAIALFSIENVEGGSGGDEHELTALRQVGAAWLLVVASEQVEASRPRFTVAWKVLERARIATD